jgi:hypothetical protein
MRILVPFYSSSPFLSFIAISASQLRISVLLIISITPYSRSASWRHIYPKCQFSPRPPTSLLPSPQAPPPPHQQTRRAVPSEPATGDGLWEEAWRRRDKFNVS